MATWTISPYRSCSFWIAAGTNVNPKGDHDDGQKGDPLRRDAGPVLEHRLAARAGEGQIHEQSRNNEALRDRVRPGTDTV